ncbi:hypothetical protein [Streptomyces atratus]|uniref:hypothetical protein n=1 Tax=Streptomyces atratus TaxID=1893 RepID=UPI00364B672A
MRVGTELRWLLLDIAERVIVPVTALDDQNEELRADSFALGQRVLAVDQVTVRGRVIGGRPDTPGSAA